MVDGEGDVVDDVVVEVPELATAWWDEAGLLVWLAEAVVPHAADTAAMAPSIQSTIFGIRFSFAERALVPPEGPARREVIRLTPAERSPLSVRQGTLLAWRPAGLRLRGLAVFERS